MLNFHISKNIYQNESSCFKKNVDIYCITNSLFILKGGQQPPSPEFLQFQRSLNFCFCPIYIALFSSFSCPHYGKVPRLAAKDYIFDPTIYIPAYRSAVNFQPDHLYTTYRSVVNFLCSYILASAKRTVNEAFH